MSQVPFRDISYAQGAYNMGSNSDDFVMIKMSGGDAGLYYDSQAARNYNNATSAGKVTGLYHFYGGGNPVTEADFFIGACSPLGENDILAIDVERGETWNPQTDPGCVAKITTMANRIHDVLGVWPWIYLNRSTRQMYDWSPVFNTCMLWIAAPDVSFDADIAGIGVYGAQQGPIVGGVDTDMFFSSLTQLKKYTYGGVHKTPTPLPNPTPNPTPTPPPPAPVPVPVPPAPVPTPAPGPTASDLDQQNNAMLKAILAMVTSIFSYFQGQYKSFTKYIKK